MCLGWWTNCSRERSWLSGSPAPGAYVVQGGLLGLPGAQLGEILDAVLARGAPVRFQARGFSMYPSIRDLDVVTVSPLPRRGLHAGDVIAFRQPTGGSLVLHRILRAGQQGFLVRGDNLPAPDGLVPAADVIGLVTLAERDGAIAYRATEPDASASAVLMLLRIRWAFRTARRVAGQLGRVWLSRGTR
jgi:signal peptidase I